MTIFNRTAVQAVTRDWLQSPLVSRLPSFLRAADRLLDDDERTRSHPIREKIKPVLREEFQGTEKIVAAASEALKDGLVLEVVTPAIVADEVELYGYRHLAPLLAVQEAPYLRSGRKIHQLIEASSKETSSGRSLSSLLEAADRQFRVWNEIEEWPGAIPMTAGALATGGDFDSVMMLLYQTGLRHLRMRRPESFPQDPLFVAWMVRPEPKSEVNALLHSAGRQKRNLPIHQFRLPFRTTAFPHSAGEFLQSRFALQFVTPKGSMIERQFSRQALERLPEGAFLVGATKSFSEGGETVDEWMKNISYAFAAGFTAAPMVFGNKLADGLDMGLATNALEQGRQLAILMTARDGDEEEVPKAGEAEVHTYRNDSLPRPLALHVYDHPALRKAQVLYAIYKNIYSGILGAQIFQWIFEQLAQDSKRKIEDIAREGAVYYEGLIAKAQRGLHDILVNVENIPEEKVIILEHSLGDALKSWAFKPGGLEKLIRLIQALFFQPRRQSPSVREAIVDDVKERWVREIEGVFATRNPRAGASLAAGMKARRFLLLNDPQALLPDVTFEGLDNARDLHRRLGALMNELPEPVRDFVEQARHIRQPTLFPDEVWRSLDDLSSFLRKRARGARVTPITNSEMEAFLGRPPTESEERDHMKWQSDLEVEDFLKAAGALKSNLQTAVALIQETAPYSLANGTIERLDMMVASLSLLEETAAGRLLPEPLAVQQLLLALEELISVAHQVYVTEDFEGLMKDLLVRAYLIYAFIEDYEKKETERMIREPFPRQMGRTEESKPLNRWKGFLKRVRKILKEAPKKPPSDTDLVPESF